MTREELVACLAASNISTNIFTQLKEILLEHKCEKCAYSQNDQLPMTMQFSLHCFNEQSPVNCCPVPKDFGCNKWKKIND